MEQPKSKTGYNYNEFIPPDDIKPIIDKFWIFEAASSTGNDRHFYLTTDFTSTLVFIFPRNLKNNAFYLSGPNTQNIPFKISPGLFTIGYRFTALSAQRLFGISPELTLNRRMGLAELIPGQLFKNLRYSLVNTNVPAEKIHIINDFLMGLLEDINSPADDIVDLMAKKMIKSKGNTKLEEVYSELALSQRQFQRKFIKRTGLSPKEFCRIVRFHYVTRKLMKNDFRHFDVLVESGYYDQSHYYKEFKEFTGMLPAKYVMRQKRIHMEKLI